MAALADAALSAPQPMVIPELFSADASRFESAKEVMAMANDNTARYDDFMEAGIIRSGQGGKVGMAHARLPVALKRHIDRETLAVGTRRAVGVWVG